MRVLILLLCAIECAWGKMRLKGPMDLGAFDADVSIGDLKYPYYPPSRGDHVATKNARRWVYSKLAEYDPFKLAKVDPLKINTVLAKGEVTPSNIVLRGLKRLNLPDVRMRMYKDQPNGSPYRIDFNASLPVAQLDVDVEGQLEVLFTFSEISGHVKVRVSGLTVSGAASAAPVAVMGRRMLQNNALQAQAHVDNIQVILDVEGLPADVLDNRDLIISAAQSMKDLIAETVGNLLLQKVNEIISQYSIEEIELYLYALRAQ